MTTIKKLIIIFAASTFLSSIALSANADEKPESQSQLAIDAESLKKFLEGQGEIAAAIITLEQRSYAVCLREMQCTEFWNASSLKVD